jgi:FtsP/CotA-like multicopper oxidase with cupredoxin domain
MKILTSIIVLTMLALAGGAQATECPTTDVIQDPEVFQWSGNEGTLEIGEASFTFNNGETLTTRAYRQEDGSYSIPGPTMYMTRGQNYVLTFKNTLPFRNLTHEENKLKDPDVSNIHTHGLHISGDTPADDVTRIINGGMCGDYVYEIQDDHMGGHNWYHPHHHGSTNLQVAGGALGNIIIEDPQNLDGIPDDVLGMEDRLLTVALLNPGQVAGDGGDTIIGGTLDSAWTTNGLIDGNLCMPVGEWQHWRVLIADIDARMKTVEIGPECEMVLMARDGVWRTTAPLALVDNEIELTGASRADLAVRCSADSTLTVDREVVANIYADGAGNTLVGPYAGGADPASGTWQANRPSYLKDLRFETTGINPDYTDSISVGASQLYGKAFDINTPIFDLQAGVQEWAIGANNHPFHLHIYHQQVQGACSGGAFEDGEYYDTISGSCDIRFDSNPATTTAYDGKTIMHCHILKHEDQGAMGWANSVVGGIQAPDLPAGKQVLYECGDGGCTPTEPTEATCNDGIDNDCDLAIDCADSDCTGDPVCDLVCADYTSKGECNNDPNCMWEGGKNNGMCVDDVVCTPTGPELGNCNDGIDNDCNGMTDCADTAACGADPICQVDCSDYTTRQTCKNEPTDTCRWNNQMDMCIPK